MLARAARLYPVEIHAFAFLSNHYHLLLTAPDAERLARFMNYLNSNLAREAGRLVRWREKFWGRRYQAILVSDEDEAQIERLRYVLAHGAKEGLVASPLDWPGAHCARALLDGTPVLGHWVDRTLEHQARLKGKAMEPSDLTSEESLHLTPLPCWAGLEPGQVRRRIELLVREIAAEAARRVAATGLPPLGRDALLRQEPHLEPNRVKKGPAPLVHAASRAARDALRERYRLFVAGFRQAADAMRSGRIEMSFPSGSFPPASPFQV